MDVKQTVVQALDAYVGEAINGHSYLLQDAEGNRFSVLDIGVFDGQRVSVISLIVLIEGNSVVIERDQNERLFVDALLDAGIPRAQIILAYAGAPVPEGA